MEKTVFYLKKMDCPSEEQMVRVKLDDVPSVKRLDFDLANRRLSVLHIGELEAIRMAIDSLNFGAELLETGEVEDTAVNTAADKKLLWTVLLINFGVFAVEIAAGLIAHSMGLVADSLDELADTFVYALSIYAVAGTALTKKRIARSSGALQFLLALCGVAEIVRRFIADEPAPNFVIMIAFSCVALAGNAASLYFLGKSKSRDVHIKATQIFTSNDVFVNIGVIVAAVLVAVLQNKIPDLVIGAVVFAIVLRGAIKIFKLAR